MCVAAMSFVIAMCAPEQLVLPTYSEYVYFCPPIINMCILVAATSSFITALRALEWFALPT